MPNKLLIAGLLASSLCLAEKKETPKPEPLLFSRTVVYHDADIVPIQAQLDYQIVLQLPKDEEIIQATSGDKHYWPVDYTGNLVFIKPALAGGKTNLNVLCASGHLYTFVASEVRGTSQRSDLRVILTLPENEGGVDHPKYVPASQAAAQVAACKQHASDLNAKLQALAAQPVAATVIKKPDVTNPGLAADDVNQEHKEYVADYDYSRREAEAIHLTGIFHDKQWTYIEAAPQELLAVYVYADGKDHLVQSEFDPATHRYRVAGIIDRGYLRIGKKTFKFSRHEAQG
jgi:type IV secretory pathway VirB9-like protein